MKKEILAIFCVMFLITSVKAQNDRAGNWLMYFGQNRLSDKWSIHSEVQYRNHTIIPNNTEQLLLRTGINFHIETAIFTAGYGHIGTHMYQSEKESPEIEEHRLFQQLITTNKIGRLKLEHRYRVEQRWVNHDFKNRLRYRLMAFIPINKKTIEKGTLFIGLYDEIFMNIQQPFFDRNRFYGALGYQLNKPTGIQVGMLHQETNNGGKWYLQFALTFNTDFRKIN